MGSNLVIGLLVLSILYSFGLNIIFFGKQHVRNNETSIFSSMLIVNLIGLFMEIFCVISIITFGINSSISIIINKAFLVYHVLFTYVLFLYVIFVIYEKKLSDKFLHIFVLISLLVNIFISIIIVLLPIELVYDVNGCYSTGVSVKAVYAVVTIEAAILGILMVINYKSVLSNRKKFFPLIVYMLGMSAISAIQRINPYMTLSTEMETFLVFLMYNTIENPDVKMIKQLEIAREQADNANKAKTDFLSSMSHEIRTPLNAIVGFSDCITDATTLDEAKENAKDIVNASETLLEIVNGILDISKIESGKLEIVNSKYNAPETFLELAKLITPKMKEKGLEFTYSIAPDLPQTLFGDHANIKKVVTNLLSNACKYTERGFVHYEVNCVNSNGVSKLIISVEDSGRGIKKENVDKMFTKFQRLDEDRNTTIEGTGLGLAITKQLIELMGGRIILHTIYGEGSKFTVVLNQKIEKEELQEVSHVKTTLDLKDVRILLVDDTPLNLKVAGKLMEKFNANSIDFCSSGFECIDKIRNGKIYDIIFLDDMMPKMSGVETLKKLKEDPNYKTPTIALTANAITGMKEKYLADGFNDYLAKPIDKNELIRVCNEVLGRTDVTSEMPKIREVSTHHKDSVYTEEQTTIIPVEEDVEKLLGNIVELGKNNVVSKVPIDDSVNDTNAKMVTPNRDVEILDLDTKKEEASKVDLVPVVDIDVPNVSTSSKYDVEYLKSNGCDMAHALELLGDMEMFNMTVHDFLEEIDNKWQRINDELNSGDMENYAIDVHSLKSDCKYLGFMGLADIAYDHELKSKDKQLDYCREHFPELEKEYVRVIEIIRNYAKDNPS